MSGSSNIITRHYLLFNPDHQSLVYRINNVYYTHRLEFLEDLDSFNPEGYIEIGSFTSFPDLGKLKSAVFIKTRYKWAIFTTTDYLPTYSLLPLKFSIDPKSKKEEEELKSDFLSESIEFVETLLIPNPGVNSKKATEKPFQPCYPAITNIPFPPRLLSYLQYLEQYEESLDSLLHLNLEVVNGIKKSGKSKRSKCTII